MTARMKMGVVGLSVLLVVLTPMTGRAEGASSPASGQSARARGWLSGVGVGLLGASLAGFGFGLGGLLNANDANAVLSAYYANGAAPTAAEAPAVRLLDDRRTSGTTSAVAGFVVGGVLLAAGVTCLVLDGVAAPKVAVSLAPLRGGGLLGLSGEF
jgi:hypothetical protein